jgi:flagellar biosynthesis/type III secretory pathway protein FliH
MSQDILEGSWFYQDVIKKGLEQGMQKGIEQGMQKGLEQGMQKGIEQGEMKTLRLMLIRVVKTHFPDQLSLAQDVAEQSTMPDTLNVKIDKLLLAKTSEEAHRVLQEAE